ncbi:MAG: hypothetical protein J6S14_15215 [Clostridia bacterium]|nr:hypothetical protein [Clostridia bacterium]
MPLRGIILILAVAVVLGIACRKEMYEWYRNLMKDPEEENEMNEKGDEEE